MTEESTLKSYKRGLLAGIPIALGYLSVSFSFGIVAISYGLTWWEATLISATTVTSAGQFSGIQTMLLPGQYMTMLISQCIINVRYSFMSISLSQKLDKKFSGFSRCALGYMMTDEIFAVASTEKKVRRSFFGGLSTLPFIGWTLGTLLGALLGNILPDSVMSALGIAIYGMFIAIVVPVMKTESNVVKAVIIAAVLSIAFYYVPVLKNVPAGLDISLAAVISAGVMAYLSPDEAGETKADSDIKGESAG